MALTESRRFLTLLHTVREHLLLGIGLPRLPKRSFERPYRGDSVMKMMPAPPAHQFRVGYMGEQQSFLCWVTLSYSTSTWFLLAMSFSL
jgi:hypothetical protein